MIFSGISVWVKTERTNCESLANSSCAEARLLVLLVLLVDELEAGDSTGRS